MCIAIVKPQGTEISDEYLKNCFENNNDGAGIAYAKDGKLYIIKGIFDKNTFIKAVRKAEKIAQGDMLIHCRISTSGKIDKSNCHPHIVNNSVVMIHNGILDIDIPRDSEVSDTIIFIQEYLKDLPIDFIKNPSILKIIEKMIDSHNKFAFLNNKGESVICNKNAGVIKDGIWYSNNSFEPYGQYTDWEISDYLEDSIDLLDEKDLQELGEYPFLDMEEFWLVPYKSVYWNISNKYIALQEYSEFLYKKYLNRYFEFNKLYKIA